MSVQPTEGPAGASSDRRQAERRDSNRRRVDRATWQSAAALLVGLVAFALALLIAWREALLARALDEAVGREQRAGQLESQDLNALRAAIASLERRAAATETALEPLSGVPGRLKDLEQSYGDVKSRIEAPQRAVARAEAAMLIEAAQRRLKTDRDVVGALLLYDAADERLARYHDPALEALRAGLGADRETLRTVPTPDVPAIIARLARAEASIEQLPLLGTIQSHYTPPGAEPTEGPGLARAWQQLTTSLNNLIRIRRVSDAAVELVSLEESDVRRHHLEALLFDSRLAALRGDETEYQLGLRGAQEWLDRFFDGRDARVKALSAEIAELANSRIAPPLPELRFSRRLLQGKQP